MPNWLSRTIPMSKYFSVPDHFDITKFSCITKYCKVYTTNFTFVYVTMYKKK